MRYLCIWLNFRTSGLLDFFNFDTSSSTRLNNRSCLFLDVRTLRCPWEWAITGATTINYSWWVRWNRRCPSAGHPRRQTAGQCVPRRVWQGAIAMRLPSSAYRLINVFCSFRYSVDKWDLPIPYHSDGMLRQAPEASIRVFLVQTYNNLISYQNLRCGFFFKVLTFLLKGVDFFA